MKKLFVFIVAILMVCAPLTGMAQTKQGQAKMDSMVQMISSDSFRSKPDSFRILSLCRLSFEYSNSDPDEGIKYASLALQIAEKKDWKKGIGWAYNMLSNNYQMKSDYAKALECCSKALKADEECDFKMGQSQTLGNIGTIYYQQENYPKALEFDLKALKINEEIGNKSSMANNLGNIGTIYYGEQDYFKATVFMKRALDIFEQAKNSYGIATSLGNIGNYYLALDSLSKSLEYYLKSLKILEKIGNKAGMARTEGNIGNAYAKLLDYHKALKHSFTAVEITKEMGDNYHMAEHFCYIGWDFLNIAKNTNGPIKQDSLVPAGKTANLHKSIDYFKRSIAILCLNETDYLEELTDCYSGISDADKLLGKADEALENFRKSVFYHDSLLTQNDKIKISKLETQRDIDLKDRDIEIKNKQIEIDKLEVIKKRNERGLFMAVFLVIIASGVVIIKNNKRIARQKTEFEKLHAVSIERSRIASDMHDDLGAGLTSIRMLSVIARQKIDIHASPESEIDKIAISSGHLSENLNEIIWAMNTRQDTLESFMLYVRTYAVAFFEDTEIQFQFNTPDELPVIGMNGELRRNIFLCIKEALHNIMKHSHATVASLTFQLSENKLTTTISDNGVGFTQARKFGNGLSTMKERLNKFGSALDIDVAEGTKLVFSISIRP